MTLWLRLALTSLLVLLAVMILLNPEAAKEYVSARYDGLQRFAHTITQFSSPASKLLGMTSPYFAKVSAAIIALGALSIILNLKPLIMLYSLFTLIVGGLLHMPYITSRLKDSPIAQIRKLVFVMAVFFCMTMLCSRDQDEHKHHHAKKAKENTDKTKTE